MTHIIKKASDADGNIWTGFESLTKNILNKDSVTEHEVLETIEDIVLKELNIFNKRTLIKAQNAAIASAYIPTHKETADNLSAQEEED